MDYEVELLAFIEATKRGDTCYWQACRHAERALRARPEWGDHTKRALKDATGLSADQVDNRIFAWQLRRFLLTNIRYDSLTWRKITSLPFSFFAVTWRNLEHLGHDDESRADAADDWLNVAVDEHFSVAELREQVSTPAPFDRRMEKLMRQLWQVYQDSEYNNVSEEHRAAMKNCVDIYRKGK